MFKDRLQAEIAYRRSRSFVEGAEVSDAEVLGLIIAEFLDWDGDDILQAAASALEDANAHDACAQVREIREQNEAAELHEYVYGPMVRVFKAPSSSRPGRSHRVVLHRDGHGTCPCEAAKFRPWEDCKHVLDARAGFLEPVR